MNSDGVYMFVSTSTFLSAIGLYGWDFYHYLQSGVWETTKISDFKNLAVKTQIIELDNIANWLITTMPLSFGLFIFGLVFSIILLMVTGEKTT